MAEVNLSEEILSSFAHFPFNIDDEALIFEGKAPLSFYSLILSALADCLTRTWLTGRINDKTIRFDHDGTPILKHLVNLNGEGFEDSVQI